MTSRNMTPYLALAADDSRASATKRSIADIAQVMLFGAIGWPWLLKSLSGGSEEDKRTLLARLDLPFDALPHLGSWKADAGLLHFLVDQIERQRPAIVVELGAGASSLVVARALQRNGGGRLISCDQHADFVRSTQAWLADHHVDADLRVAPLREPPAGWPGAWYDHGDLPRRIDLLVIDGPPWSVHPMVRGAADSLFDRVPVGGVVILDDAARPGERLVARKWKQKWPDFEFELIHPGTKGTLIGTRIR